ncbi:MAG: 2-hydroxyglutaryl-CoA dehydratase [Clostridia bacterium]|nr:2-hydroxyglutaryl-CoA dehydratase [Clostridia bacterium]
MKKTIHIGMDVGSTTVKIVVMDEKLEIIHTSYERHFSDTKNTVCKVLEELVEKYKENEFTIALTGSGAMSTSQFLDVPFIQEVVSCKRAVEKYIPETNVVIELGGEDAKIIYFGKSIEQRMNGTCAGGTGAFLDQMASLLNTDTAGLNELAKGYKTIYPIASRCGVFAKTDVQPLLNEGAAKEDIAVSIFQAVVNQTISGLACGRPIRGNIAFLGGPLNYLPELRKRFIETLNLSKEQTIIPEEAHLFVAKGACLDAKDMTPITVEKLKSKIQVLKSSRDTTTQPLQPLFKTDIEYKEFEERHAKDKVEKKTLSEHKGDCFIGIDAGSTTSKLVVTDREGTLLYSSYKSNEGKPLQSIIEMLKELYSLMPKEAIIRYSGVTGYGEKLIQTALNVDLNEIETIAHYTAAKKFEPKVTSIVDIGGQDMKYIKLKNNTIDNIMLNEACSSGCGSFIETFAKSLNIEISEFVNAALEAQNPVDLGSRCTVFMNSKIKQAQKEGYSVGDISAGLSYSVIKNAIQKVMKIRDVKKLGSHIVVQGGTFYNEAVLRAFELIVGRNVIRPDIAGLMGAYGMALLSCEQYEANMDMEYKSTISNIEQIDKLDIQVSHTRCNGCENHCQLTINRFSNGKRHVSGNRCEKGEGIVNKNTELPNLVKYKNERIFGYTPLEESEAPRGTIGIPRVLNMYEDFPFWFTLFTNLGFRVIISEKSTRKIYEKGMESMPSESVCYPAKISHGHIISLIQKGIKTIFYPCMPYSRKEFSDANNRYNCPIVISYAEVIKNNVEELKTKNIKFMNPFLPFEPKQLMERMMELEEFKEYNFTKKELKVAIAEAEAEYKKTKEDIHNKGKETLEYIENNKLKGIVLAGRPYHVDPEINHGIDTLITSLGMCVLTEDSISDKTLPQRPLRVVDQWMFHSRLYAAADFVGKHDNLELVQINSFGCGVDAVTTDQVEEILTSFDKMYTLIKIDEVNNLGAVRIRLRSLLASINKRLNEKNKKEVSGEYKLNRIPFTEEMKKEYTIIFPQMAPIHFEFIEPILKSEGYKAVLLRECTQHTIETGLKYVNNDACYPSIITTGQFIEALESGEYDVNKTAIIMSQTGGGCRATNYIGFIRKALKDAGFEQVPVISFNVVGMEKNPGFKLTLKLVEKLLKAMVLADLLQKMLYKNRAYEKNKGETETLFNEWMEKAKSVALKSSSREFSKVIMQIVEDFEKIEWNSKINKPRVGIVGEILIKYHPFGNNYVADLLEKEGAEVVLPDFLGFVKFMASNKVISNQMLKNDNKKAALNAAAIKLIDLFEKDTRKALAKSKKGYLPTCNIWHLAENVKTVLSTGNQTGEGWFLTAEMLEYMENGIQNIVCVQPFACLPNHVVGKGVIKTIRDMYPEANIVPVDYDPGASEANQTNRIKLLMTVAKDNLKLKQKEKKALEKENETSEVNTEYVKHKK